jgi:hypothetical protein
LQTDLDQTVFEGEDSMRIPTDRLDAGKLEPKASSDAEQLLRTIDGMSVDRSPTDSGVTSFARDWLREQSKDELVEIILALRAKLQRQTTSIASAASWVPFDAPAFEARIDPRDLTYVRLVFTPDEQRKPNARKAWRAIWVSTESGEAPVALEVYGDAFVGRSGGGITPDLDLSRFGAEGLGVSRHHALLRPTSYGLQLTDMDSTNGTYVDGKRLRSGSSKVLQTGDVISFSKLHFSVRFVEEIIGPKP